MLYLKYSTFIIFFLSCTLGFAQSKTALPSQVTTLTVNQFLNLAVQQTEDFQSLEKSLKSLEYEIEARDLQLGTQLQLSAVDIHDRKDSFTNYFNRDAASRNYGVNLTKSFSTGTSLSLGADYEIAKLDGSGNKLYRADWDLSLTQDLWKNSFGRSVRLRRKSDQMELFSRKIDLLVQKQELINKLEDLYWDYSLFQKELVLKQENLKRGEQILSWTNMRLKLSAARDTDLLQVQALLSSRKLELADIERLAASNKNQMDQFVPSLSSQNWSPQFNELEQNRDVKNLVYGDHQFENPVLLSSLSARFKARKIEVQSEATQDNLNPVLQLQLAHSQNGIRPDSNEAIDRFRDNKTDANQVGLIFSMNLDQNLKGKSRDAAQLAAEAANLQAQRLERSSRLSWIDLKAQIDYLKNSLQLSQDLYQFQKKNITSQRRYFQQGRNTIFEFINFEIVAADAELRYFRTLNQLRKAESTARLFSVDQIVNAE